MMHYLGLTLLFGVVYAEIITPIPVMHTDPGVRYDVTSAGARIRLDVMLETNCPDSVLAWPELKHAAQHYGPDVLDLVIYQFQVPYHIWGHLCTTGFYAILGQLGPEAAIAYMEYIFSVYYTYGSAVTKDRSYNDMLDQLANDACNATGIDQSLFKSIIDNYSSHTVLNWKLACTRGAAGVPWYYLNGVNLGINYPLTFDELKSLIDPLVSE